MGPTAFPPQPLRCAASPSKASIIIILGCTVGSDASWPRASRPGAPPCQREADGVLAQCPKLSTDGRPDTTVPRFVSPLHDYCGRGPCGWSNPLLFRGLGGLSSSSINSPDVAKVTEITVCGALGDPVSTDHIHGPA
ncbi:hypothetical protein VTN00DRAFT_6999 [Thermoascus crustaceus]|uniref:uncharacterized protein n=1 Tax=Thermoascus crustaceus TaxID=5088 RepID=UPI0037437A93